MAGARAIQNKRAFDKNRPLYTVQRKLLHYDEAEHPEAARKSKSIKLVPGETLLTMLLRSDGKMREPNLQHAPAVLFFLSRPRALSKSQVHFYISFQTERKVVTTLAPGGAYPARVHEKWLLVSSYTDATTACYERKYGRNQFQENDEKEGSTKTGERKRMNGKD